MKERASTLVMTDALIMRSVVNRQRRPAAFQATTVGASCNPDRHAQVAATQARLATVVAQKKAARMALEEARAWMLPDDCTAAGDGQQTRRRQKYSQEGKVAAVLSPITTVRCVLVPSRCTLKSNMIIPFLSTAMNPNEFLQWIDRRSEIVAQMPTSPASD
jgi:hypothetical protein